ncbi:MAG: EAL domain-containing protein [Ilumatobacter sp.]|uniref:EAL domain-containing protein n=1 Tax=Ilumatobacter sp. TaxID=1967498 RepID=UPI00329869AF
MIGPGRPFARRSTGEHELGATVNMLRRSGALIAIDDAGAGHSGLQQILQLRPSIVKLDRSIIEGVDRDESKVAMVEMLGVFANRVDAWLLAEGVETGAEARRLFDLGVPLVQGYFFGRPSDPWSPISDEPVHDLRSRAATVVAGPTLGRLMEHVTPVRRDAIHAHD